MPHLQSIQASSSAIPKPRTTTICRKLLHTQSRNLSWKSIEAALSVFFFVLSKKAYRLMGGQERLKLDKGLPHYWLVPPKQTVVSARVNHSRARPIPLGLLRSAPIFCFHVESIVARIGLSYPRQTNPQYVFVIRDFADKFYLLKLLNQNQPIARITCTYLERDFHL